MECVSLSLACHPALLVLGSVTCEDIAVGYPPGCGSFESDGVLFCFIQDFWLQFMAQEGN
ncbi:hypothetical protein KC19_7G138800 [Ceratodon purpureus]|uniref:Uncharacterized protein n=1 Tax=Ceratodon purpureus TaxID=3225 RepID=A0A8T0H8C6_CERPU|nr:hypothetical protein KC19_7G138800 [Ceratodon purpureus]